MSHDPRSIVAAGNNGALYEAVFQAHGLRYERLPFAFVSKDRPPPYYSHLTVLAPDCVGQVIPKLSMLAQRFRGAISFKDSFCEFDLRANGFEVLFDAAWLWRAAEAASGAKGWSKVEAPSELRMWEAAWKRAGSPTRALMFPDSMLQSPEIAFLGKKHAGEPVSGCIANLSNGCVGISNLFSVFDEDGTFEEATAAVASTYPRLPIVGYAANPQLEAARRAGFEVTGALRVLAAENALFAPRT